MAFPILMARRPNPLVPLGLFRNRRFADQPLDAADLRRALRERAFQALFLQGALGYTAPAAGSRPADGSSWRCCRPGSGRWPGGSASRPFLVVGPLSWPRACSGSRGSRPTSGRGGSRPATRRRSLPPAATLIDVLPDVLLFGRRDLAGRRAADDDADVLGARPERGRSRRRSTTRSAASASRSLSALIFVVVSGAFYATLAAAVAGRRPERSDPSAPVQPLNPPPADAPRARRRAASRPRSTPSTSPRSYRRRCSWAARASTASVCGLRVSRAAWARAQATDADRRRGGLTG